MTTNLVHRRDRTAAPWWRSSVVCDLPGSLSAADLRQMQSVLVDLAALGFTAVLVRPATFESEKSRASLGEFITAAQGLGLKVLVRVFLPREEKELEATASPPLLPLEHDTKYLQHQAQIVLDLGANGVDLGMLEEDPEGQDTDGAQSFTAAVQELLAEVALAGESTVLSAAVHREPREQVQRHLTEDWFHHLRDDSLTTASWDAAELSQRIMVAYADRDPLGQSAAWRYSLPRWSPSPLTRDSADYGWAAEANAPDREMAMLLLTLALPGAAYVPFLDVGGGVRTSKGKKPKLKVSFDRGRAAQLRSRIAAQAIAIRLRLGLGDATLASVEGLEWAGPKTLVMLSGTTMVVLNTGETAVIVPPKYTLAISSKVWPQVSNAGTEVAPNSCAWFHAPPLHPAGPRAYR